MKTFFSSPRFAVAGASSSSNKFGNKSTSQKRNHRRTPGFHKKSSTCSSLTSAVFSWYIRHHLPVTPLNPNCSSISLRSKTYETVPSPLALPCPTETSLSIVTPPRVTLDLLKEAKQAGVPAVWLQPGTYDAEGLEYARREFKAGVGGQEGHGGEGWCVLVDGKWGMDLAGRDQAREEKL